MTDILEPSRRVKELRGRIFNENLRRDMRLINDALREIQSQCLALEIQLNNGMLENQRLVHEANIGLPDEEIAF